MVIALVLKIARRLNNPPPFFYIGPGYIVFRYMAGAFFYVYLDGSFALLLPTVLLEHET